MDRFEFGCRKVKADGLRKANDLKYDKDLRNIGVLGVLKSLLSLRSLV